MRPLLFLVLFSSFLLSQKNDIFVDGVAAIVEDNIVLKSDLNQMLNMMAIQQKINPNKDFEKYIWLIQSDQKKIKGVFAIAEILKRMGFSWMILGFIILTPPFSFAATGVYALVSKNRKRFGNCCS